MQDTSLKAFFNEVAPTLGARQIKVLECFEQGDELTNSEIAARLDWSINRVTPRVFELRKQGLLSEATKRTCRITGRTVIAWRALHAVAKPETAPAMNIYQFESKSRQGETYRVSERSGKVLCSCPSFRYRGRCRHSGKISEQIKVRETMPSLF